MSNNLIFYTNPQSRGCIVRWMLEELGLSYRTEVLEYGESMKTPKYLAINPMGKVPTLIHGERIITEAAAICVYLAEVFGNAELAPKNDDEKASYYRWMFFASGPLESAVVNKHIFGEDASADKQQMLGYGTYQLALDTLSELIKANDYILGDRFTAADVYIGSQLAWGMQFGTIEKRKEFQEYVERLSKREAFQRAHVLDQALLEEVGEA
ncbi:glutathione S-transferase family protein [Microbulbifer variabilis]|uniref:glutathione S-transferase family protein n=1 Tax=Microbulbifer variabilis TaxID=266805 RepID=UPI001CFE47AB|nr:glutathione S-transferase family protein [Microbulbifer variabilis]